MFNVIFDPDTAAGNTVLRMQHLLDACTPADKTTVLDQLAALANVLARGDAPREIAHHLAGASLIALDKKDGSIRPIAVGKILRRLVGKALCKEVQNPVKEYFWPLQVGVACALGIDSAIHTVGLWKSRNANTPNRVILKFDFAAQWVTWCYG